MTKREKSSLAHCSYRVLLVLTKRAETLSFSALKGGRYYVPLGFRKPPPQDVKADLK